jgi:hypothetical protein
MERKIGDWRFVVIWEFQVRLGQEERFEQVCGADGVWAQFFRQDEAYVGTDLIRRPTQGYRCRVSSAKH